MHRIISLLALVLLFTGMAMAQDQNTPRVEIFGGYSHLVADVNGSSFNLNGAHVSATESLNSWFGGVLDFSAHYGTLGGLNVNTESIMYGALVAYRKSRAITPFAHASFGATRGSAGYLGISKSDTHLGMAFGGGVDVKLTERVSFRVIQADYLQTNFLNLKQYNIRASSGLVFRLGRR
jgi:opacity protein-like surface antigen